MTDLISKLSISISGKGAAKQPLAEMVVIPALVAAGVTVTAQKFDKHGAYLSVEVATGSAPKLLGGYALGDDVELRDGEVRAKMTGDRDEKSRPLIALTQDLLQQLENMLYERQKADALAGKPGATDGVAVPPFHDPAKFAVDLVAAARDFQRNSDAELQALGFCWPVDAAVVTA